MRPVAPAVLAVLAAHVLGCSDETPGPGQPSTGDCPAGEWRDETDSCVPAGLPPDLPCPPGQWQDGSGTCVAAGLPPDLACSPGELELGDGSCQPAGLPPDLACPPGELELGDGSCQPAGVPPEACAPGFVPDGDLGCEPVMPAAPCPAGQMAVPGDAACRAIAPCGTGTWGDIPVTSTTEYVDRAYTGGNSDGTPQQPWTTIAAGIAAASPGAIVAIAEGSYPEELAVAAKAVRLWGRCPDLVEIVGPDADTATVDIGANAVGTELHDLAVTGGALGVRIHSAENILLERVWIHGNPRRGVLLNDEQGAGSLVVRHSLVEGNVNRGVVIVGGSLTVEGTVVRDTLHDTEPNALGFGVSALESATEGSPSLVVSGSVIETSAGIGLYTQGAVITVEGSVLRETEPNAEGDFGRAISAQRSPAGTPSTLTLRTSLVADNHDLGVAVLGGELTVETTVIRDTVPHSGGYFGHGIHLQENEAVTASQGKVSSSLVERNGMIGICANGSEVSVEGTVVRDLVVGPPGSGSAGIAVVEKPDTLAPPRLTVRSSVLTDNADVALWMAGMEATIEGVVVRNVTPDLNGEAGWGIGFVSLNEPHEQWPSVVRNCVIEGTHKGGIVLAGAPVTVETSVIRDTDLNTHSPFAAAVVAVAHTDYFRPADLTARGVLMEDNRDIGVFVSASTAHIEGSVVRRTKLNASGTGGLGAQIQCDPVELSPATVDVEGTLFEDNHRIGIGVIGAATTVEASVVRDTQPDLEGRDGWGISAQYHRSAGSGDGIGASLQLRSSLVEGNHTYGVAVVGSEATLVGSVVRDTQRDGAGLSGRGLQVQPFQEGAVPSSVTVSGALIENNVQVGVMVLGSEATIERTIVRDTSPNQFERLGTGIVAHVDRGSGRPGLLTLRSSLVERSHEAGVLVWGSQATIETSVVRDTRPNVLGDNGRGVAVQGDPDTGSTAALTLLGSLVQDSHVAGVAVMHGTATVDRSVITDTLPDGAGLYGDGILVVASSGPASATVSFSRIEQSARAAIASFGGDVAVKDSLLLCQSLDLNGETYESQPFNFDDGGGNGCGCPEASGACAVVSSSLDAPAPMGGLE